NVDAELLYQLGLASQRRELGGMTPRAQDLRRMRVEGEHHTGQAPLPGRPHRLTDQRLVPLMHAVEHADRDHAPAPITGKVRHTTPSLHVVQGSPPEIDLLGRDLRRGRGRPRTWP